MKLRTKILIGLTAVFAISLLVFAAGPPPGTFLVPSFFTTNAAKIYGTNGITISSNPPTGIYLIDGFNLTNGFSGGGSNYLFNQNQFSSTAGGTNISIRDGVLLTNMIQYGLTQVRANTTNSGWYTHGGYWTNWEAWYWIDRADGLVSVYIDPSGVVSWGKQISYLNGDGSINIAGQANIFADGSAAFAAGGALQIGPDGNLDVIKAVPYTWPAANAVGAFTNNGVGALGWFNGYVTSSITNGLATTNYVNGATNTLATNIVSQITNGTLGVVLVDTNGVKTFPGVSISPGPPELRQMNNVILDTDCCGEDIDDVGDLAILHLYQDLGLVNILAVTISQTNSYLAPNVEIINNWFGRPWIPVGKATNTVYAGSNYYGSFLASSFYNSSTDSSNALNATILLRRTLAAAPTNSVKILVTGQSRNIFNLRLSTADTNSSLTGDQLIASRVREIIVCAGVYPNPSFAGQPAPGEFNFFTDPAAAATWNTLTNLCPVTFVGIELGNEAKIGSFIRQKPFDDVVRTAYNKFFNVFNITNRSGWGNIAAVYTVLGLTNQGTALFALGSTNYGYVTVDGAGSNTWTVITGHNQKYLRFAPTFSTNSWIGLIDGLLGRSALITTGGRLYRETNGAVHVNSPTATTTTNHFRVQTNAFVVDPVNRHVFYGKDPNPVYGGSYYAFLTGTGNGTVAGVNDYDPAAIFYRPTADGTRYAVGAMFTLSSFQAPGAEVGSYSAFDLMTWHNSTGDAAASGIPSNADFFTNVFRLRADGLAMVSGLAITNMSGLKGLPATLFYVEPNQTNVGALNVTGPVTHYGNSTNVGTVRNKANVTNDIDEITLGKLAIAGNSSGTNRYAPFKTVFLARTNVTQGYADWMAGVPMPTRRNWFSIQPNGTGVGSFGNQSVAAIISTANAEAVTNEWAAAIYSTAAANLSSNGIVSATAATTLSIWPGHNFYYSMVGRITNVSTSVRAWIGYSSATTATLGANSDTPTTSHSAMIRLSSAAAGALTNWALVTCDGSACTATAAGAATLTTTNVHVFEIIEDRPNTRILAYVDGLCIATNTANLPASGMRYVNMISTLTTVANTLRVNSIYGEVDNKNDGNIILNP